METNVTADKPQLDPQVVEALDALESAVLDLGLVVSSNTETLTSEAIDSFRSYVRNVIRMSQAIRNLKERQPPVEQPL